MQRFISVSISGFALVAAMLFGFPGCEGNSISFNEQEAVYHQVSGDNAMAHVEALVGYGSRYSGSEELAASRDYLQQELEKHGWTVKRQVFEKNTPDGKVEFVNMRARFNTSWERSVTGLICSHYDTKKFRFKFVGANDGGSSTGLLLEFSRVLAQRPEVARRLELVFFDGEEAFGPRITTTDGLYGSKYYATQLASTATKKRPRWGVLLDMIGDADLNIRAAIQIPGSSIRELKKAEAAGHSVDIEAVKKKLESMARDLMSAATDLEARAKFGISPDYITDDHIPLNAGAGIPTINIIDFDYDPWHTPADTLDKISAGSMETVGKVTLLFIEKYLVP